MSTATLSSVQEARARIDELNRRIIELLAERQTIVDELCDVKAETGQSVRDPDREAELITHVRAVADDAGLPPDLAESLFEDILEYSVQRQRRRRAESSQKEANCASRDNGRSQSSGRPDAERQNGTPSSRPSTRPDSTA